jgi:hypothetical protein
MVFDLTIVKLRDRKTYLAERKRWRTQKKNNDLFRTVEFKYTRCPHCLCSFCVVPLCIIYKECCECSRCGKFLFIEEEHAKAMSSIQEKSA